MKFLKAALIGRSLEHSISPQVHRQLFPILHQKCHSEFDAIEYSKIELQEEENFFYFIRDAAQNGFRGINVTFPYKYVAATIEGERSRIVDRIHSANAILFHEGSQVISTDGLGFLFALQKSLPHIQFSDYSLTVLGAGGAARAVLDCMYNLRWKVITIAARVPREVERSVSHYENVSVIPLGGITRENISRDVTHHFIVQATPVGQRNAESLLSDFAWQTGDIAVDLVYNPRITRFLDIARQAGATIIDGLGMLIEQAALSQYFWMMKSESNCSVLTNSEFQELHRTLSKFVTPTWDAFAI